MTSAKTHQMSLPVRRDVTVAANVELSASPYLVSSWWLFHLRHALTRQHRFVHLIVVRQLTVNVRVGYNVVELREVVRITTQEPLSSSASQGTVSPSPPLSPSPLPSEDWPLRRRERGVVVREITSPGTDRQTDRISNGETVRIELVEHR